MIRFGSGKPVLYKLRYFDEAVLFIGDSGDMISRGIDTFPGPRSGHIVQLAAAGILMFMGCVIGSADSVFNALQSQPCFKQELSGSGR